MDRRKRRKTKSPRRRKSRRRKTKSPKRRKKSPQIKNIYIKIQKSNKNYDTTTNSQSKSNYKSNSKSNYEQVR